MDTKLSAGPEASLSMGASDRFSLTSVKRSVWRLKRACNTALVRTSNCLTNGNSRMVEMWQALRFVD